MENNRLILTVIFVLTFTSVLAGEGTNSEGTILNYRDKLIRALPKTDDDVHTLKTLENSETFQIDFWKSPRKANHPVDMLINKDDFPHVAGVLSKKNIKFQTQLEDVQKAIDDQNIPTGRQNSFHDSYHNLYEIHQQLNYYQRLAGLRARIINIGASYEGRTQKAIEFKGSYRRNKPIFFLQCGIHAREWVSPASCIYIAHQMATDYGSDRSVTALLDKMDFIILPVVNVDGYAYTWLGKHRKYRLWRKTRSRNPGYSCVGTDPNRNWDHKWGSAGASKHPCDETYRGRRPFSEKETTNVKNYLIGLGGRLKGFIDTHSYSQMWFTPWGWTSMFYPPDYNEQVRVASAAVTALGKVYGTKYQYGSSAKLLYAAAGGSEDWTYGKLGIKYSFGTELRDTGKYGFLLPANQIIPTAREYFEGIKALVAAMRV